MNTKTDAELKDDVLAELEWEPSVNEAEIGVIVKDGVVTLTGTVEHWPEKAGAESAVKQVAGVRALVEAIEVRLPGSSKRSDTEIAEAALDALKWNISVPQACVKVKVENGWVTLEGKVDWQFQKQAAEGAVHHLTGVRGVTNWITIEPKAKAADVKARIEKALERNARLDAQKIQVEIIGDKVILRGNVHSWAERREAASAAWAAPGVSNVENDIKITYMS